MDIGLLIGAILFFALVIETLAERFAGKWLAGEPMKWLTAGLGIAVCVLFGIDGMKLLQLPAPIGAPYTGEVLTGLIVGSGSNIVHDLLGKWLPAPVPSPPPDIG